MKFKNNKIFLKKLSQVPESEKIFQKLEDTKKILLIIDSDDEMLAPEIKKFMDFLYSKKINFEIVKYTLEKKPKTPSDDLIYIKKLKNIDKNPKFLELKSKIFDSTILISRELNLNSLYLLKSIPSKMKVSPDFEINVADITFIIDNDLHKYFETIKTYLTYPETN